MLEASKLRDRTSHSQKKLKVFEMDNPKKAFNKFGITERSIELAEKYSFFSSKSELNDSLHLRYGWEPANTAIKLYLTPINILRVSKH